MADVSADRTTYKLQKTVTLTNLEFFLILYPNYSFTLKNNLFHAKTSIYTPHVLDNEINQTIGLNWHCVFTPIDVYAQKLKEDVILYESFLVNWWGDMFELISSGKTFISRTGIFPGRSWPEREMREKHKKPVYGLKDARRLLTDYTTALEPYEISYNHLIQEII